MCKRGDVDGCICLTPGTLHRRAVHFTINQLNIDEKSTFNTTEAAKEEEGGDPGSPGPASEAEAGAEGDAVKMHG